jgi:tricorn protease
MKPEAIPPAYLRQPTLCGDSVVFVSDDDLWRVSAGGGSAQRLTAGLSEPATPCLSPDGQWLAYAGRDEQHAEVWLMPASGGAARRLTWLGSDLAVRGWTPDGRIVFCSNHGQPFFRNWHASTLDLEGGLPERVPLGQINHLAFGPGGRRVIGRNTADPARWKRYRGGTAGHLWMEDEAATGQFTRLSGLQGNITSPMWLGGRLFFLSDFEGIANLYSCAPDSSALKRHTDHTDYYARHASSDGQRIVYQCGAELWLYEPGADRSRPIAIDVPSARTQAQRRFVPAAEHLQGVGVHPAGHSLALEVRGQMFMMALWEGGVRQQGNGAARRRLGHWLADGKTLVCASDAMGEEGIELSDAGTTRLLDWGPDALGRVTALRAAPQGGLLAIANHRNELWVGDTASGTLKLADRSDCGRIEDPVWSPCGGWLAYTFATSPRHTAIKLCQVGPDGPGRTLLATQPEFRDWGAAFDPEGRWLYFLSLRTYDPVYDSVQFELSFPRAARPYLIALQAGGAAPFEPLPKGMKGERDDAPPPAGGEPAKPLPAIEPEGLARRVAAFPVPEGRFGQIAGVAGGKVVWTALPIAGAHGRGGHKDAPGRLEVFDFATLEVKTLVARADSFTLAADSQTLIVRTGSQLRALDARKAPDDKAPAAEPKATRAGGLIDLGRIRVAVTPMQEWTQLVHEVWRMQRDHFWVPDMSGIDWPAMLTRYAPLLPRVATRGELSDLIWELQGELGTSHAYEMGGDHRKPPAVALGHLAAELRAVPGGWEIASTVQGDAWDAAADSPLNAVGVQAQPGERIVAVGGQPATPEQPPQALLVHQANSKVALTLAAPDGTPRDVLVTALADETPARYREWVERNRAWVHETSGGRVGYFHLPDMMSAGFAEFHRYFGTECDRDALVVDVRYNRGGHVSQLLLEKVARKRIAWNIQRWGQPSSYPEEAPAGAVVALTNEHAGSDGDIFSHGFKLMGIGALVGQRTWGGVIGIWPRHKLIDGTDTTQPEYSFWFKDVGWAVENYGTDPTIEVANAPQDDAFNAPGRDRQLAAAVAEALAAIDRQGVSRPDFGPRPQLRPRPLKPR